MQKGFQRMIMDLSSNVVDVGAFFYARNAENHIFAPNDWMRAQFFAVPGYWQLRIFEFF